MNNPDTPPQDSVPESAFKHDAPGDPLPTSSAAPRSAKELQEAKTNDEHEQHMAETRAKLRELDRADLHARVDRDFVYHAPKPGQPELYTEFRDRAKELAHWMVDNIPPGRELSRALSDLEDAVMHGNSGIARNG